MFNISFDFDETTKKVSNVKVNEIKSAETLLEGASVAVLDSKLQLSKDAVDLIKVSADERITVSYWTEDNENTFPVIGPSSAFAEGADSGNKLTKSNTVSFRGLQRKTLLKYGSEFKVEPFKDKLFKLVSDKQVTKEQSLDSFASSIHMELEGDEDSLPF